MVIRTNLYGGGGGGEASVLKGEEEIILRCLISPDDLKIEWIS